MQTFQLVGHIIALGRPFLWSSIISLIILDFQWEMGKKICFCKDLLRGNKPLVLQFLSLYRVSPIRNSPISSIWLCNFQVLTKFHQFKILLFHPPLNLFPLSLGILTFSEISLTRRQRILKDSCPFSIALTYYHHPQM